MTAATFIHPTSDVQSTSIGPGTKVWQFCAVLPGAAIGADCNICSHCFIESDVIVGDDVTVKSGVKLWDGVRIGDRVFIGPDVTFANDVFPRSKQRPEAFAVTTVMDDASIGANATILPGVTIGANAMVGAGSVVTKDVPPNSIVMGNPAQISGYVDAGSAISAHFGDSHTAAEELHVEGVSLHALNRVPDLRGELSAAELGDGLPFEPQRLFFVYDVPSRLVRGEHAHRSCHQFLICPRGSVTVMFDDGHNRQEVFLDAPNLGLWLQPGVWAAQYRYSSDAVLVVAASHRYDADDYIRDYDEFLAWKANPIAADGRTPK